MRTKKTINRIKIPFLLFKEADYNKRWLIILFVVAILVSLAIRVVLIKAQTFDFIYFLNPWMEHMHQHGLAGLGDNFANYNAPYLILLWVFSYLPFPNVVSVKLISIIFDVILSIGVLKVVGHFKHDGYTKYIALLATLFAPTVIQNSSLWGQCDAIYTSFIIFAFYAFLKKKFKISWILWGVAFAFKLQAIFFAPFMIFAMLYRRKGFSGPLLAVITIIVLSSLPLVYGKSLHDALNVYLSQTKPAGGVEMLAWFSPSAYQWLSNAYFPYVRKAGVLFGGLIALGIVSLAFVRRYSETTLLVIATMSSLAIPFFLPQIHERYFFTSEILLIITAAVLPRFIWAAIVMQIVSSMTYITYFTGGNQMPPIPFAELSLALLVIIALTIKYIFNNSTRLPINPDSNISHNQI